MKIIKKVSRRPDADTEVNILNLIESLMNKDRKSAENNLRNLVIENVNKKIDKFTKSEPLI